MSQPLGKGCGDAGQSCATTPKCSKENSQGHTLILEKVVNLEDNDMQESQKNAINPFCPGSSSGWVWELMGCGIHHGNMDLWGCLSQPGGFNLSSLPGAGGDLGQAFACVFPPGSALHLHQQSCQAQVSSHPGSVTVLSSGLQKPK